MLEIATHIDTLTYYICVLKKGKSTRKGTFDTVHRAVSREIMDLDFKIIASCWRNKLMEIESGNYRINSRFGELRV